MMRTRICKVSLLRISVLCETYCRTGQHEDAVDTFRSLEELCDALGGRPSGSAVAAVAMSLQGLGRQGEAQDVLAKLRQLPEDDSAMPQKKLLYEAERTLAGEDTEVGAIWRCLEEARLDDAAGRLLGTQVHGDVAGIRTVAAAEFYQRGKGRKHHGGDYKDAMNDYAMAVELDPNHTRARRDLAWLQAACPAVELRDKDQAVTNATRACELTDWKDHQGLATLAAVCAQTGDFTAAVSWQKKAIDVLTQEDEPRWRGDYASRLRLYASEKPYAQGDLWSFSTGGLIGWWKFDEPSGTPAADASGNGNDGAIAGTPHWQPIRGGIDGALRLDDASVRVAEEAPFDVADAITLSIWTRTSRLDTWWQALITKGDSSWRIHRSGDRESLEFTCNGLQSPTGASVCAQGSRVISDGQWHHVAATYDGSRIALYVDGQLDASCPAWGRLQTNDHPVCIGDNAEKPGRRWNGWIDDVRIYSCALSEAEIAELHRTGLDFIAQLRRLPGVWCATQLRGGCASGHCERSGAISRPAIRDCFVAALVATTCLLPRTAPITGACLPRYCHSPKTFAFRSFLEESA